MYNYYPHYGYRPVLSAPPTSPHADMNKIGTLLGMVDDEVGNGSDQSTPGPVRQHIEMLPLDLGAPVMFPFSAHVHRARALGEAVPRHPAGMGAPRGSTLPVGSSPWSSGPGLDARWAQRCAPDEVPAPRGSANHSGPPPTAHPQRVEMLPLDYPAPGRRPLTVFSVGCPRVFDAPLPLDVGAASSSFLDGSLRDDPSNLMAPCGSSRPMGPSPCSPGPGLESWRGQRCAPEAVLAPRGSATHPKPPRMGYPGSAMYPLPPRMGDPASAQSARAVQHLAPASWESVDGG